ncbi:MAG: hypothetical protein IKR19_08900 [Acholeplasmatales bacterium]|nr:hypothetical protein [Acholeplasmatales bacterium]
MPNAVYQASVDLSFEGERIDNERIEYIMIDYRYDNINILPVIYIAMKIPLNLHDEIISNYESSKFYLRIDRKNAHSGGLAGNHISGSFSYVCSNKDYNSSRNLNVNGTDDRSYVETVVGLVSSEMMDSLRSSFNDVYIDTPVESLVLDVALGDMGGEVIHSPIKYSEELEQFLVPPTSSRFKFLETLFERYPFFDTNFNFFMDFDNTTYLLDKTGEPVAADPDTIYFNVTQVENSDSIFPGNSYRNGSSQIYVNATQMKMNANESVGQIANKIAAFDYDTGVQELSISKSFSGVNDKKMYLKSDNAAVYKNEIVNNTISIELYKQSIDSSIITPNRLYIVTNEGNYSDYNGRYLLAYKQEIYAQSGDGSFNQTCTVGLKKINAIEVAGAKEDTSMSVRHNRYGRAANKTSSADRAGSLSSTAATANDRNTNTSNKNYTYSKSIRSVR